MYIHYYQTLWFDPFIPCGSIYLGALSSTSIKFQVFLPNDTAATAASDMHTTDSSISNTETRDAKLGQVIEDPYARFTSPCSYNLVNRNINDIESSAKRVKYVAITSTASSEIITYFPVPKGGNLHFTANNLKPNTMYRIAFLEQYNPSDGTFTLLSKTNSIFTTFPEENFAGDTRIVFGSCTHKSIYPYNKLEAYKKVKELDPRFVLLLGDNVYTDLHEAIPSYRTPFDRAHRQVLADVDVRNVLSTIPSFTMFDDHEIENDFNGGRDHPFAKEGLGAWEFYWGRKNPEPLVPLRVKNNENGKDDDIGDYFYQFNYGGVADVFVLQSRLNVAENVTVIGEEQKSYLLKWLLQSKQKQGNGFKFRIIASPVSWSWDGHGNVFVKERREILCFIEKHRIDGVLILSGDMHYGAAYQYQCPELDGENLQVSQKKKIVTEFSASPFQAVPFPNTDWPEGTYEVEDHNRILFSPWAYHFGELNLSPSSQSVTFNLHRWNFLPPDEPKVGASITIQFTEEGYFMKHQQVILNQKYF